MFDNSIITNTKELLIRQANLEDATKLINHFKSLCKEPDIDFPFMVEEITYPLGQEEQVVLCYKDSNSICLVAEDKESLQIVGVVTCKGDSFKSSQHIVNLGLSVHKDWRNKGVGRVLMEKVIEWARSTNIVNKIELEVYTRNKIAIKLYENLGFVTEGVRQRAFYQSGEYWDSLRMALHL